MTTNQERGKPQLTLQFGNDEGGRYRKAIDSGWGNKYWARIKSSAIIGAALSMEPQSWVVLQTKHSKSVEENFTTYLGREFQQKSAPIEYVVVRAKSDQTHNEVYSWYFIHGLDFAAIADDSHSYSEYDPEVLDADSLERKLTELFTIERNPPKRLTASSKMRSDRRWDASKAMNHALRLARIRQLILMSKEPSELELVEGLGPLVASSKRLAKYLHADLPLIHSLKSDKVAQLLKESGLLSDAEINMVMREYENLASQKIHLEAVYPGLPKHGAEQDRETGKYYVRISKLSSTSIRTDNPTLSQLGWETSPVPDNIPEDERYLE